MWFWDVAVIHATMASSEVLGLVILISARIMVL